MACWLCEHAQEVNKLDYDEADAEQKRLGIDYDEYKGMRTFKCRLNPVWVDVKGSHVCGQFRDDHWTSPYVVQTIRNQMDEPRADRKIALERAKNAERKLKAANAKIRELKAAKNG
jgi:hypothetical protein